MSEELFIDSVRQIRTAAFIARLAAERHRGRVAFQEPDWIWTTLIEAAITLGRVPREEVLHELKERLSWHGLPLNDHRLQLHVQEIYRTAGVRFSARKTPWAVHNRRLILDYGGTTAFKSVWAQADLSTAIDMLCGFHGVGLKYARNIGMLAADPRFEDCAALDVRLLNVARHIKPEFPASGGRNWYWRIEDYLRGLARRLGISLWQLDRTMFWKYQELGEMIGYRTRPRSSPGRCKAARQRPRTVDLGDQRRR